MRQLVPFSCIDLFMASEESENDKVIYRREHFFNESGLTISTHLNNYKIHR